MKFLGIETSCDETAMAVVCTQTNTVLWESLYSQYAEHADYGGVVPEVASRSHLQQLPLLWQQLQNEKPDLISQIDAVAATTGPGLLGALLMGATFGKSLSMALNVPFIPTNHLEGHALVPMLTEKNLNYPYLLLLVSGLNTQLVEVRGLNQYIEISATRDDAAGECLDKSARVLQTPQPFSGAAIEALAKAGNATAVPLPRPLKHEGLDFSFAGLKTAVLHASRENHKREDIAASLLAAIADVLATKCQRALKETRLSRLVVAGGVAKSTVIRAALTEMCTAQNAQFYAPDMRYCTDNAVMIAYAAGLRAEAFGLATVADTPRNSRLKPRWPLADVAASVEAG